MIREPTAQKLANEKITLFSHPKGLFVLSFAEMFERFSYYGMRSLLLLYMVRELKYMDERAYSIYGIYVALIYATPLIGGYLADKVIGFQRAILIGSIIIILGHLCMAFSLDEAFFYTGLGLVISGTGLFKSNISAMVGMLYNDDDPRRDAGYTLFYLVFNAGGFLSPIICGYIGIKYGWSIGFGLAGFGMIVAFLLLMTQRHHLSHIENSFNLSEKTSAWAMIGALIAGPIFAGMVYASDIFKGVLPFLGIIFLLYILREAFKASYNERKNILILLIAIGLLLLSGALVEQAGMALTLFADRNLDKVIMGWEIPTTFIHSIDPLTVIFFGGFFSWLWIKLASRGKSLKPSTKYLIAFTFIGAAYLVLFVGCDSGLYRNGSVPFLYAFFAMVLLALGDICIYPVTLSLCSQLSPKRLQGVMMGAVMMGVAFSQLLGSIIAKFSALPIDNHDQQVISIAALTAYQDLFKIMVFIAIFCIILTVFSGLWMNKHSKSPEPGYSG